jgi:hypothetical protein
MAGRATRLQDGVPNLREAAQIDKRDCLLLDFVDNYGRHSIVTSNMLLDLPQNLNRNGTSY